MGRDGGLSGWPPHARGAQAAWLGVAALLFSSAHLLSSPLPSHTGPDRKLYLPGGLLDPSEVPAYLNGTLPGE